MNKIEDGTDENEERRRMKNEDFKKWVRLSMERIRTEKEEEWRMKNEEMGVIENGTDKNGERRRMKNEEMGMIENETDKNGERRRMKIKRSEQYWEWRRKMKEEWKISKGEWRINNEKIS